MKVYCRMDKGLVSVIIPAYNGAKYLAEAIESVLAQDYPYYEIIVVDNASIDNTAAIAKSYSQVKYIYSDLANTCMARNTGIQAAHGEYVAFLDQDDTWLPYKLSKQIEFLQANPNYAAVISLQKMYLEDQSSHPAWLKQEFLDTPQNANLPSALMVRHQIFKDKGLFAAEFSLASDVAWFFKAKHQGILIGSVNEVLIHRRIHAANASHEYKQLHSQILQVIQQSLRERRKS